MREKLKCHRMIEDVKCKNSRRGFDSRCFLKIIHCRVFVIKVFDVDFPTATMGLKKSSAKKGDHGYADTKMTGE